MYVCMWHQCEMVYACMYVCMYVFMYSNDRWIGRRYLITHCERFESRPRRAERWKLFRSEFSKPTHGNITFITDFINSIHTYIHTYIHMFPQEIQQEFRSCCKELLAMGAFPFGSLSTETFAGSITFFEYIHTYIHTYIKYSTNCFELSRLCYCSWKSPQRKSGHSVCKYIHG